MKRLGAIIAIALVLTIGGVYATFNYANGGVVSLENQTISKELIGMTIDTPKGKISIKEDSNFKITVDDFNSNLHTTGKLEGTTTINFTPAPLAAADVRANGIKLKLTITVTGNEYDDGETTHKLFNISQEALDGVTLNGNAPIRGDYTIDFADYITVTDIYLSTPEKYTAYSNAFKATTITFTISETV